MSFKTGSFTSVGNRGLNPTISLARTRRVENPVWNFTLPYTFQGTVAGYTSGGYTSVRTNVIDKFPFATDANATDVGDLTVAREKLAGQSSDVSGYASGGLNPIDTVRNVIDKFPFASNANATDVGDLTVGREVLVGQSSDVSGYASGGQGQSPPPDTRTNIIDKFPFATNANATDVGDLTVVRKLLTGQSSTVNGYTSGGDDSPPVPNISNVIDKFPFATNANATDVGDLTVGRYSVAGQSSDVSGYTSGGRDASFRNIIDKFPFATDANATDVGDLITTLVDAAGQSSTASGYSSGGYSGGPFVSVNVIQKFPFATNANATDVGDLTLSRRWISGQQN